MFRARAPDGIVAVKILGPASELDDAARARFHREIAALGTLSHPHLISLVDHGIDTELGPYLVVPLLPGTNLRGVCGGRALCPEAAVLIALPIIEATAALHAQGYVHRDLKPENVIAGPDGAITVIDLGLAWHDDMSRHTDTGAAVGSVGYMAPEQLEGHAVDQRADVWALGVMIFEWITGKRPFARARPAEEAAAVLVGACARLAAADRRASTELSDLVARCLSLDPSKRPSAPELASALAQSIDWTDDAAAERAAVIADPVAYQQRVAPFRVRRLERQAREAIEAGKPFAALAACDRGLAYAPEHAALLELVAEAELAAGSRPSVLVEPATASSADASTTARTSETFETGASTTAQTTVVGPAPSATLRRPAPRWRWFLVGALGIAAGAAATYALIPDRADTRAPDPAPSTRATGDREMLSGFMSIFDRALDQRAVPGPTAAPTGPTPTTARGWLELAGTQEPAQAVASVRRALALSPEWLEAQVALCVTLAGAHDDGAIGACTVALKRRPTEPSALAARGTAYLRAKQPAEAIADLDRLIAVDPDPKWRLVRARAKTAAGDARGAARDLAAACDLGDATACSELRATKP